MASSSVSFLRSFLPISSLFRCLRERRATGVDDYLNRTHVCEEHQVRLYKGPRSRNRHSVIYTTGNSHLWKQWFERYWGREKFFGINYTVFRRYLSGYPRVFSLQASMLSESSPFTDRRVLYLTLIRLHEPARGPHKTLKHEVIIVLVQPCRPQAHRQHTANYSFCP